VLGSLKARSGRRGPRALRCRRRHARTGPQRLGDLRDLDHQTIRDEMLSASSEAVRISGGAPRRPLRRLHSNARWLVYGDVLAASPVKMLCFVKKARIAA